MYFGHTDAYWHGINLIYKAVCYLSQTYGLHSNSYYEFTVADPGGPGVCASPFFWAVSFLALDTHV